MRLHDAVRELAPGQRLRISEITAVAPLAPEERPARDGIQVEGLRRWWTPPLTDAQMLAYWNRIVLKKETRGNTIYLIVTTSDVMDKKTKEVLGDEYGYHGEAAGNVGRGGSAADGAGCV